MAQIVHHFQDGSSDPGAKPVPAKIVARLEQILADAKKRTA